MSLIGYILLLMISILILGVFIFSWITEVIRRRDYVNRIVHDQHGALSKEDKKDIIVILRRVLGLDKSSVEIAIEKLKRQQSEEINKRLNPSLIDKLQRSGVKISVAGFYLLSLIPLIAVISLGTLYDVSAYLIVPLSVIAGFFIPRLALSFVYKRRLKSFTQEFPNAIDVMVRGLRSGLPLVDCLRIISQETQEPVRGEFKKVISDQSLGMSATEAILKLAERIPTTEVNFLAIVIKIQNRTGGSLTEALENLSNTLRERRKLQDKIVAMSQEAKSSAAIISAMPILVAVALYFFSPEYIGLLFSERAGQIALAISAIWMAIGVLIMRKMIDFEV